jgi:DNA-binding NtrC family response regulator
VIFPATLSHSPGSPSAVASRKIERQAMEEPLIAPKSPLLLAVMDPIRSRALIQQIEEQGVSVIAASGRDEARSILQSTLRVPIVLTDESLPDGDWRDVLQDVTASGRSAEVVVCTGSEQSMTLCFELLDHGAFGLVSEPFDRDQLTWLINAATSRSRLYN